MFGDYSWLTITMTLEDGKKITLQGRPALDLIGQLERGGWRVADKPDPPKEDTK